jgi:hypothetical protein
MTIITGADLNSKPATLPTSNIGILTSSGYHFYDNSTLNEFRVCFRRGYFSKLRNFEPLGVRKGLLFGTCWHAAMDVVWGRAKELGDEALLREAFSAFKAAWELTPLAQMDDFDLFPRTPGRAAEMLLEYVNRFGEDIRRKQVLAIESPFIVPLTDTEEKLMYIGKLDKIVRDADGVRFWDHKSAANFGNAWIESFSPNSQMDGYSHAGHMTYGTEFQGCMIDGALVQKSKIDFKRIPVSRIPAQLDAWLYETLYLIQEIQYHENLLAEYRAANNRDNCLRCFPKNTSRCTEYFGVCPYLELCKFQDNPDLYPIQELSFQEHKWQPFDIFETSSGEFKVEVKEGE